MFTLGFAQLDENGQWCHVLRTAHDGATALVILRLRGADGLDLTRHLLTALASLKVGILTTQANRGAVAPAEAHVQKDAAAEEMVEAIRQLSLGDIAAGPGAAEAARSGLGPTRRPEGLTERDIEVLRLVSRGFDNKRIAQQLYISPKTVRNRVSNLYFKLGLPSRAEVIAWARDNPFVIEAEPGR